jgi:antitoxin component of RelBE/YafQ-DinJ toxin-antitoxin module
MGYLQKVSKKKENEPKTQPVSTRLTENEFKMFYKLCEDTGYSISEALRVLVKKEINEEEDVLFSSRIQKNTDRIQMSTTVYNPSTNVNIPSTTVYKKPIRTGAARFTTGEWNVDNFLPCPLCNTWVSAANFSRHAKGHEMTSQEIFEKYKEKADKMVQERSI